jgi:hypothetical protein
MTIDELTARVKAVEPLGYFKVNVVHHDGGIEGVWVGPASAEDAAQYKSNCKGTPIKVLLLNNALVGIRNWGALITVITNGDSRPTITAAELVAQVKAQDYPQV